VEEAKWLSFIASAGFDGWEEASWELNLRRCDTDDGNIWNNVSNNAATVARSISPDRLGGWSGCASGAIRAL